MDVSLEWRLDDKSSSQCYLWCSTVLRQVSQDGSLNLGFFNWRFAAEFLLCGCPRASTVRGMENCVRSESSGSMGTPTRHGQVVGRAGGTRVGGTKAAQG